MVWQRNWRETGVDWEGSLEAWRWWYYKSVSRYKTELMIHGLYLAVKAIEKCLWSGCWLLMRNNGRRRQEDVRKSAQFLLCSFQIMSISSRVQYSHFPSDSRSSFEGVPLRLKSKTSEFSLVLWGLADFGMQRYPDCNDQWMRTWEGVFKWGWRSNDKKKRKTKRERKEKGKNSSQNNSETFEQRYRSLFSFALTFAMSCSSFKSTKAPFPRGE